jgi:hypothetical protein
MPQKQKGSEGLRWWTAAISEEMRPDWTGDYEGNCQNYRWVVENEELDLVEGSALSGVENQGLGIVKG